MSIAPQLRASARSAYRALLRAAASTFSGDDRVYQAFRAKARSETLEGARQTDPEAYSAHVQHARDVADILRHNIVQGQRVMAPQTSVGEDEQKEVWRLKITEDTEIGHNDTIKVSGNCSSCCSEQSTSSDRRARRSESKLQTEVKRDEGTSAAEQGSIPLSQIDSLHNMRSMNFSALKRAHKERAIPDLREEDIEESFVRGGGPGGQSINKTQNNVQLLHKPTGIRVSCQETRSLQQNRNRARKILLEKIDRLHNPGLSKGDLARAKQTERERRRKKKARKKMRGQDEIALESITHTRNAET